MGNALGGRVEEIREEIRKAAESVDRPAESVKLLAVTKTVDAGRINEVIRGGIDCIGENRVQELLQKEKDLLPCERHFIGTLQANKVAKLLGRVSMIHSLCSVSAMDALEKACRKTETPVEILIQVNIGGEESKGGVSPNDLEEFVNNVLKTKYLRPSGLMTIPPFSTGNQVRAHFASLRILLEKLQWVADKTQMPFDQLSMGMSHDFVEAIEEGATIVRIGTYLFGEREYSKSQ